LAGVGSNVGDFDFAFQFSGISGGDVFEGGFLSRRGAALYAEAGIFEVCGEFWRANLLAGEIRSEGLGCFLGEKRGEDFLELGLVLVALDFGIPSVFGGVDPLEGVAKVCLIFVFLESGICGDSGSLSHEWEDENEVGKKKRELHAGWLFWHWGLVCRGWRAGLGM